MADVQDFDEAAKLVCEAPLQEYDRVCQSIAYGVYRVLRDECFDWLMDRALAAGTSEGAEKYWLVLADVGYFSDGYSESFIRRACNVVIDPTNSQRSRVSCASGALRWEVFYRPHTVYGVMWELCDYVLHQDDPLLRQDRVVRSDAKGTLTRLERRERAIADLREERIEIPMRLLEDCVSGKTTESARLIEFGFDEAHISALRTATVLNWSWSWGGSRRHVTAAQQSQFAQGSDVLSPAGLKRDILQVAWAKHERGCFRAIGIRLYPNPSVWADESWCPESPSL